MSYNPSWKSGEWKAICDCCGRVFKSSQLRKRWDGFMVCDSDWEPRHPQDFVRAKADRQAPKWTRPEPQDVFVVVGTPWVAGFFTAGTSTPGLISGPGFGPTPISPTTF